MLAVEYHDKKQWTVFIPVTSQDTSLGIVPLKGRGAPPESRGRTISHGDTTAANLYEEPALTSLPPVQDEISVSKSP